MTTKTHLSPVFDDEERTRAPDLTTRDALGCLMGFSSSVLERRFSQSWALVRESRWHRLETTISADRTVTEMEVGDDGIRSDGRQCSHLSPSVHLLVPLRHS